LNFLLNERFAEWFKKARPGERNDHGSWNGQNLVGIDPRRLFLEQQAQGKAFSLRHFVQGRTELCRVLVRDPQFSWVRRYGALVVSNPRLGTQTVGGYELVLDFNGLPFQLIPRPASDFHFAAKYALVSVNTAEYERNHCRKLVTLHGSSWTLSTHGQNLLNLLLY
jgi:hypothetical protein